MAKEQNIYSYGAASGVRDASIASLIEIINAMNKGNINSQNIAVEQEKLRGNKQIDISKAFNDFVKNVSTEYDIGHARRISNSLDPIIKDNPEAYINKLGSDAQLNETASDYMSYKTMIDSAYDKYQYAKNLSNDEIEKWTLKDIMNEQDYVNDFLSSIYEDPIDMKNPVKFAGHYISKGVKPSGIKKGEVWKLKDAQPALKDISIINEMKQYKDVVNTAIMALRTGNVINDGEMFYVLTGDFEGLQEERERIQKTTGGVIKSYKSSLNSIKKYRKQLDVAVAKRDLKGDDKFPVFNVPFDVLQSEFEVDKDSEWFQNKDGTSMNFEEYQEEKLAQYEDMTVQDVLDMWTGEEENLIYLLEEELMKYYKWVGSEYMEAGAKDRDFRRRLQETRNQ